MDQFNDNRQLPEKELEVLDYTAGDSDDMGFEEFIPYFDDGGNYKYVASSGLQRNVPPPETGYGEAPSYEPAAYYGRPGAGGYYQNSAGGDSYLSSQLIGRINRLDEEMRQNTRRYEEERNEKLSEEVAGLKEQLAQLRTREEIKREVDKLKREFRVRGAKPDEELSASQMRQGDYTAGRTKEELREELGRIATEDDIAKLINKAKYEGMINEGDINDIVGKINDAIDRRLEESIGEIVEGITYKIEQKLSSLQVHGAGAPGTVFLTSEADESVKADDLYAQLSEIKDDIDAKHNDMFDRFMEIEDKLGAKTVLGGESIYAETLLDDVGVLKATADETATANSQILSEIRAIKETYVNIDPESLKEGITNPVIDELNTRFEAVNMVLTDLQEGLGNTDAAPLTEEIREQILALKQSVEESLNAAEENIKAFLGAENVNAVNEEVRRLTELTERQDGSLTAMKEASEAGVLSLKESINESAESVGEQLRETREAVGGQLREIQESVGQGLRETMESVERRLLEMKESGGGSVELENVGAIKDEIGGVISALKEDIRADIEDMRAGFAESLSQIQETLSTEINNIIEPLKNLAVTDIAEKIEKLDASVADSSRDMAGLVGAIDGMSVSVDNLLKQSDDNARTQNDMLSNIHVINAELSRIDASFAPGELPDYAKPAAGVSAETIDAFAAKIDALDEKFDALAERFNAREAALPAAGGEFTSAALEELKAEMEALRDAIGKGAAAGDVNKAVSAIYTELKMLRNELANYDPDTLENVEENYLKMNMEIRELRKQLGAISEIAAAGISPENSVKM